MGAFDGARVVGIRVGTRVVGNTVGTGVGGVGIAVGEDSPTNDGAGDGATLGAIVSPNDGLDDGVNDPGVALLATQLARNPEYTTESSATKRTVMRPDVAVAATAPNVGNVYDPQRYWPLSAPKPLNVRTSVFPSYT